MRRLVAIQVVLALAPAVFSAPFLHLHRHEETDHFLRAHRGQVVGSHTHLSVCTCGDHNGNLVIATSADDDDAIFLNWFQDNPHPAPSLEFILAASPVVPTPEPSLFWADVPGHRSHDPPLILSLSLRSPPTIPPSSLGA